MWWPTTGWVEGSDSMGAESAGLEWVVAGGVVGGADHSETYVLVANENDQAASITVRALLEDGSQVERQFTVAPHSRYNVPMGTLYPALADKKFGVVVVSTGSTPTPIFVEGSVYGSADGSPRRRSTSNGCGNGRCS